MSPAFLAAAVPLRTPLYNAHAALGATFVEFAGYDMPVHYGSIKDEHFTLEHGILALQGPKAKDVLAAASASLAPKFHHLVTMDVAGVQCMVSGTGYTGEKGVELYVPSGDIRKVWDHLLRVGATQ